MTVAPGWLVVPMKFGWTTLVISSEFDSPESLAGLSWPVTVERYVGDVRGVGDRRGSTRPDRGR